MVKDIPPNLGPSNDFTPIRLLINIAVMDLNEPGSYLTDFIPPLRISVAYKKQDLFEASQMPKTLKLAFHDGKQWNVFGIGNDHQFRLLPPSQASIGEVVIFHWSGDPPIAWGG